MPQGCRIEAISGESGLEYRWLPPTGGWFRYVLVAFLLCWLCGWLAGLVSVGGELLQGGDAPVAFLSVWLAFWTLGGGFAIAITYALLRPPRAESVVLGESAFRHERGSASITALFLNPWAMLQHQDPLDFWRRVFFPPPATEVERRSFPGVSLQSAAGRQRLSFDHGAERIEIGESLREPEREWLAGVIDAWAANQPAGDDRT